MRAIYPTEALDHINALSAEKLELYRMAAERGLTDRERARLDNIKRELSEAWQVREQERVFLQDPLDKLIAAQYKKAA